MKYRMVIFFALFSSSSFATQAQPVPVPHDQSLTPQIEISGVGAATLKTKSGVDFDDSAILVGAAQRLSDGGAIGSASIGWVTPGFLNQAFVDYQAERIEALIGRSDNPTSHVVDFPTVRGDDLVTLVNPLNPFSNGENPEEHRSSDVASVTFNQGLTYFENIHVQRLINSAGIGSETGINSYGATFERLGTPGMEALERVPSFGFGFEHFIVNSGGSSGLNQAYAGGVIRLNTSVTHRWELQIQDVVGFGSDLRNFGNVTDSYQADSNSVSSSLRYLSSPFGQPGYQLSLTGAYKNYFKVSGANSYGGALTGVKRLGQGFELVAQYLGQWRDRTLARVQSQDARYEQTFEVGFVFSFSGMINQHLLPRRTILNQQHQYVPN